MAGVVSRCADVQELTKDARHKLAFWFLGDLVTGGTAPYMDLPATASSHERSARGYSEGRFRGQHLLYGEVEYRGALTSSGLLGIVAFLNTTTVDNTDAGQRLFESFAPGAGFGFRYPVEQAIQNQPLHGLRLGQGRLARILSRHPGRVLSSRT